MPIQNRIINLLFSMTGIILCGGQSTRMGSDKGLLKLEAKTWAQTAIDKLSELGFPVKISVNSVQYREYAEVFAANDLIPDHDSLSIHGPLLGVLSSHLRFAGEDLFVFACDMPLMEPDLLKELFAHYEQQQEHDAFVFVNDGEPEPLCAIYTSRGLSVIFEMLQNGQLKKHSMKFMLDRLSVFKVELKEEQKKHFRNFNAHAELNGL
jgi:molybdopterin-guanine dinucleotide biosynthesis protein A